ncbi:TetR/AcrR family transcriptional regulator [Yinghuangia seranimata]|uniref:TetR/AcrR family transcriptional regulator n=1 Tax=Yinghuangia seranimata TaxID=408067 RepID=UPI00248B4DD5|nr:TetR/AcrR family transcriptional regulator C-terminal domain-containing protein [Yinghuangia seranimata]MDI2128794.1 TetR/AcrR family transcriptional regulator C-terminal domain-containing protein [Yinghuangia seranimata]
MAGTGTGVPGTRRRGGAGGRVGLTPERIVDGCLALLDEQGPEAFTFRRIGGYLGVDPTALYRHFRDKDELVLAVADRLLARALEDFTPTGDWRATLTDMLVRNRTVYLAHPEAAVLSVSRTTRRAAEMASVEITLGALADAGFPPEEAVRYYRVLVDFVLSWCGLEAAYLTLDQAARSGDEGAWSREYAGAPADRYPHIAAAAPYLPDVTEEGNFMLALELLLDSIELRATKLAAAAQAK